MNHSPFFDDNIKSSLTQKVNEWVEHFSNASIETPDFVFTQHQLGDFFSTSLSAIEGFCEKQKSLVHYLEKTTLDIIKEEEANKNILNALNLSSSSEPILNFVPRTFEEEVEEDLRVLNLKKSKIAAFFMDEKDNALILDSALYTAHLLARKLQEAHIKLKREDMFKAHIFKEQLLPQIFQIQHIFERVEKVYSDLNHNLVEFHQKFDAESKEDEMRVLLNKLAQPS